MKYRYREPHEMKDSGVEWLGTIPNEWRIKPHKYIMTKNKELCLKYNGENILSLTRNGVIVRDLENPFGKMPTTFDGYQKVKKGNLLMCLFDIDVTPRCIGLIKSDGLTSPAYSQFILKQKNSNSYYNYLLRKIDDEKSFLHLSKNLRNSLTEENFGGIKTIQPKSFEQQKIADFLDQKTLEFDSIIEKKEKLIEKLEEAKKSLISEVVTGKKEVISNKKNIIDENGQEKEIITYELRNRETHEMKDSGVEWLGMIPKEWGVSKIKYSTYVKGRIGWQGLKSDEFIEEGPHLVTGTDFAKDQINWDNCYRISEKRFEEAPAIQLKNGDLLITKDGTIGKIAIVKNCPKQAILNSGIFVTRCINNEYLTKYMFYMLTSEAFKIYIDITKTGSTIAHLYQETFVKYKYTLPKIKIQKEIINYLDQKTLEFDSIIERNKKIIEKLKEGKQSLISEAVTGKIEILD